MRHALSRFNGGRVEFALLIQRIFVPPRGIMPMASAMAENARSRAVMRYLAVKIFCPGNCGNRNMPHRKNGGDGNAGMRGCRSQTRDRASGEQFADVFPRSKERGHAGLRGEGE